MESIERRGSAELARPLPVLAPLIRAELEAGDAAGIEHYRCAGEMLLEAKDQCAHGEWTAWVERNFHLSKTTALEYMKLAGVAKTRPAVFSRATTMSSVVAPHRSSHQPAWQAPVQRVVERVDMKALVADSQSKAKETKLVHDLAEQLIDIGYRVLAAKLHPDKGGSSEAMSRLNKVKAILRGAI
jgi:threonyl-tRNA synthetase